MSGSRDRHTVPEVARLLGISERGVRDRITRGTLQAERAGTRWMVLLPAERPATPPGDDAVVRGSPRGSEAVATPAVVEQAIARTGQRYTADLHTMLAELREIFAGQVEAKDQVIATQAEALAELRRRAEVAEATVAEPSPAERYQTRVLAERGAQLQAKDELLIMQRRTIAELREQLDRRKADEVAAWQREREQAAPAVPHGAGGATVAPEAAAGVWRRLWRWWGS